MKHCAARREEERMDHVEWMEEGLWEVLWQLCTPLVEPRRADSDFDARILGAEIAQWVSLPELRPAEAYTRVSQQELGEAHQMAQGAAEVRQMLAVIIYDRDPREMFVTVDSTIH